MPVQAHRGDGDFKAVLHHPGTLGGFVTLEGRSDVEALAAGRRGDPLQLDDLPAYYTGRAALIFQNGDDGDHHFHSIGWDEAGRVTAAFLLQSWPAMEDEHLSGSGSPEPEPCKA